MTYAYVRYSGHKRIELMAQRFYRNRHFWAFRLSRSFSKLYGGHPRLLWAKPPQNIEIMKFYLYILFFVYDGNNPSVGI